MPAPFRPLVIAVCGSPAAGKTTIARATAERLGLPLITRDGIKAGLGWSSASPSQHGGIAFAADYHVAGGPFSRHAERILTDTAVGMVGSGASLVVETSVLSIELIDAVRAGGAQVLAVHVVASTAVIEQRLQDRLADGGPVAEQLASLHRSGEMDPTIFEPPGIVDVTIEVDTSEGRAPDVEPVEVAATALIAGATAGDRNLDEVGLDVPAVRGVNHVTISASDVERSVRFYTDVLGCRILARWPKGAYLLAGDLWLAIVRGTDETRADDDYSHIAFDASPDHLAQIRVRARAARAERWQENWTEGESIYLLDPSGRRIEVHSTNLVDRLRHATEQPWDGLVIAPDAISMASRGAPG